MGCSNDIYKKKNQKKSGYAQIFLQDWTLHSRITTSHSPIQKSFLINQIKKSKFTDPLMIDLKRNKILTALLRSKRLVGGVLWEPYPSHHSRLFSPLLVLRYFAAREGDQYRSAALHLPSSASAGCVICGTDLAECVSVPGGFLRPQGALPQAFTAFGGRLLPGASGECRRGCRHFLEMPGACWLRPCTRTYQKKASSHTCLLGGADIKYRRSISVLSEQYETSYLFYVCVHIYVCIYLYIGSAFT